MLRESWHVNSSIISSDTMPTASPFPFIAYKLSFYTADSILNERGSFDFDFSRINRTKL